MGERADYDHPDRPKTAQPPPIPGEGRSMHDVVIDRALDLGFTALAKLTARRKRFGLRKYDTTLQAHNGRDPMVDGMEELLDACAYFAQAVEEERPRAEVYFEACVALAGALSLRMPAELVEDRG